MPVKLFRGKHLPIVVNSYLFFSQLVPTQTIFIFLLMFQLKLSKHCSRKLSAADMYKQRKCWWKLTLVVDVFQEFYNCDKIRQMKQVE